MITSRLPSTSTTVVKISTLASIPMTQAGRALPSVASARSSCPSRGSVRFFMSVNGSGITGPQPKAASESQLCFMSRRYRRYRWVLNETWSAPGSFPEFHKRARQLCYLKASRVSWCYAVIVCDLHTVTWILGFFYLRTKVIHPCGTRRCHTSLARSSQLFLFKRMLERKRSSPFVD